MQPQRKTDLSAAATGIAGLDSVLRGGLTPNRLYLVEGMPGSGKTTLAMQFLMTGARAGEPVLYVTLSETDEELRAVAESHGWNLDGVTVHEVVPTEESLRSEEQYTVFHPSEVELTQTTQRILSEVERVKPKRIVFDSLSEMRLLAGSALRYRRQILAMKRYFSGRSCTVIMLDDLTAVERDLQVQSIAHGVILLEQLNPEFGAEHRRLRVVKFRGVAFRGGYHDYNILRGGLEVFPRLVAAEHRQHFDGETLASGIVELDGLLGGGIEQGTSTLIAGPPGTGKSSLAARFANSALLQGKRAAMFVFDENIQTLLRRTKGLGSDLQPHLESGSLTIQQVDPAELTPGEFAQAIRRSAEDHNADVIVIDSLNGYMQAMPDERNLTTQLHELLTYLAQLNTATILISGHQGLIGSNMQAPVDASYLADTVLLLRYFEAEGSVRQAISVVKKRSGAHERTIREYKLEAGAIRVGDPLVRFRGVLTGVPIYDGGGGTLMESRKE